MTRRERGPLPSFFASFGSGEPSPTYKPQGYARVPCLACHASKPKHKLCIYLSWWLWWRLRGWLFAWPPSNRSQRLPACLLSSSCPHRKCPHSHAFSTHTPHHTHATGTNAVLHGVATHGGCPAASSGRGRYVRTHEEGKEIIHLGAGVLACTVVFVCPLPTPRTPSKLTRPSFSRLL
jgi:hypothetical protein